MFCKTVTQVGSLHFHNDYCIIYNSDFFKPLNILFHPTTFNGMVQFVLATESE